jgi:phosphohistidine phosphatase
MRHAQAAPPSGDGPWADERRCLTARGRLQARCVGEQLGEARVALSSVRASPLVRTVQTAELLAGALGWEGVVSTEMALAPGGRLSELLASLDLEADTGTVLLVGHEPAVGAWASALTGRRMGWAFEPSCGVALDFDGAIEPGAGQPAFRFSGEGRAIETA